MFEPGLVDVTGRVRSPAATPGHWAGCATNKGLRYPADPPTVEEIILVMREARPSAYADRTCGLIAILWRAARQSRLISARVCSPVVLLAAHDGDDLLDRRRVGRIPSALVARWAAAVEAWHRRRRPAATSGVEKLRSSHPRSIARLAPTRQAWEGAAPASPGWGRLLRAGGPERRCRLAAEAVNESA